MPAVTAGDLLTLDELARFRRASTLRGAALVLHAWLVIAAAIALYALRPGVLTLLVMVAVVGSRQLGLAVLMHEAAHWLLFPRARVNTWVGDWLCGAPAGADLREYRRRHHLHHRHTQQPEDPDLALSRPLPVARGQLLRALLADLSGWTALSGLARWRPGPDGLAHAWRRVRAPALTNGVLFGVLFAVGGWPLYLFAWLVPRLTWYRVISRVRDIAEHGMVLDAADPLRNARTIRAGVLARIFLAPYWVNYHLEHHLMVFVPCWKLRRLHAHLLARGLGERIETGSSYLRVLRQATSAR